MRQVVQRFGEHDNAFGFLRLVLASLVIVSHTPEIIDGDRHRELLTQLFQTISFGEFAVDGFFIISGFLITGSFLSSSSVTSYIRKRIARIYPAFIVSSLVCVMIIGPATGAHFKTGPILSAGSVLAHFVLLLPPAMTNVFPGTYYRVLNGAAWTIQYEFLCYVLVLLFGRLGLLRSWRFAAATSIISLLIFSLAPPSVFQAADRLPFNNIFLLGNRLNLLRLGGMFFAGATFYLLQDRIPIKKMFLLTTIPCFLLALLSPLFVNLGFAIFGSYILFAIAALGSGTIMAKINNRDDISYGVYLYAWPIEKTLVWLGMSDSLFILGTVTFIISAILGAASWFLVEKPVMAIVRSISTRKALASANS